MASDNAFISPVLRRLISKRPPKGIEILAGRWDDQPDDDDAPVVARGGEGSGHYGHAGIPGHQGGSLPGEAGQAGEEGQSRITHPPEFYERIADEANQRKEDIRRANEEKYGFKDEDNIGAARGTANTNPAFRWLQERMGADVEVYRGKGRNPNWTDSVNGQTASGLFVRDQGGNEVLVHIFEGQHDWSKGEIHLTHIFATTPGTGLGTRVMEALKDYADLRAKPLYVEGVANERYFSGLGWMEPDRDNSERMAWARNPESPNAQPSSKLSFVYRPPIVSKEYTAQSMAWAASEDQKAVARGGPGSGHFEHAGIPGHRGGSLPGEAGQAGEGRPTSGAAKPTPRIVVSDRVNSHLFGVPGGKLLPEHLKVAWAKAAQDAINRFAEHTNYYPDDVLVTNDTALFLEGSTVGDKAHEAGYLESIILGAHNGDTGNIWMQDVRGDDFMPDTVKWHQGLYHELGHWVASAVLAGRGGEGNAQSVEFAGALPKVPLTYLEPIRRDYDYPDSAIGSEYVADLFADYVSFQTGLAPEGATGPVFRRLNDQPWTEEDVSNFQTITRVMSEVQDASRKAGGKALRQRAASATLSVLVIYNRAEEAFVMPADEAPEPVEGRVTVLPLVATAVERGGPGSGHYGHAGIPGHQGGSLPGEGGQAEQAPEEHYGGYKIQHGTLGLAKGKVALVIPGAGNTNWHDTLDEALKQAKEWDASGQESRRLKVIRDAAIETVKAGSATKEDLRTWAGGLQEWQDAVGERRATGMLRDLGLKAVEAKRLLYKTPSPGLSNAGYDIYFLEDIYAAYKKQYGPAVERVNLSSILRRLITKGGPGSGHYGHAGIPGHQGGSLPGEAGQAGEEHEGGGSQTSDRVNAPYLSKMLGVTVSNADVQGLITALKSIPENESIPSAERRGTHYYSAEDVESELNASWREFWLAPDGSAFNVGESGHDWAAAKALAEHYYKEHNDELLPRMTLHEVTWGAVASQKRYTLDMPLLGDTPGIPSNIAEGAPKENGDIEWTGWGFTEMGTTGPNPTPKEIVALNPIAAYEGLLRRSGTGTEEGLAAYGFVRVSRGGSKRDAAAGVSWDATLPPTQAQKDALSGVVSSVQANGGSILWETLNQTSKEFGVEGDAKDEDGFSAFWSAIDGDYATALAKRTKPTPELAMRFLVQRGGPGSGHYGHAGRPGERGGSLPGEAGQAGEERPQPGEMLHKWELAGLGTRPYRLVDFWSAPDRGLLEANPTAYNAAWATAPATTNNAFGSCEYCGTPITNHYVIQSDDKRRFCVGSECVRKTGEAGLVNALKRYEAKERQVESQERYVRQVEEGKVLLETHRAALSALPHPNEGMARSGRTLYDYYRWGIAEQNFGKSGTASGIRNIKKVVGLTSRGGEGSGHYGHAGIPGHQGGSLPGEAGQAGEEAGVSVGQDDMTPVLSPPAAREGWTVGDGYWMEGLARRREYQRYRDDAPIDESWVSPSGEAYDLEGETHELWASGLFADIRDEAESKPTPDAARVLAKFAASELEGEPLLKSLGWLRIGEYGTATGADFFQPLTRGQQDVLSTLIGTLEANGETIDYETLDATAQASGLPNKSGDMDDLKRLLGFRSAVELAIERALYDFSEDITNRGGPGSGHFGHEGIPGHRGGSMPGDGGAQDTRVGITGQHSEEKLGARIVPDWQLKKEMEALRGELVDAGVQGVRVEMGRGGYQGGWEQSWVLSYKGVSDAAKRILAETAAKYGQDSFVVFEPPTEGNSHAASNLSLDVDGMDPTVVANIEARLTEHNFGGWTWSEVDGKPRLQLNVVPEFGGDDQKHPAMVAALETDLKELGIKYQRDDWRAAVTAVGPGVKVEYQTYLESLRGRSLTGYRQGYIVEDQKGVDDGNVEGVGGAGAAGVAGEGIAGGNGEVQRMAEIASEGVAEPGAVGRQPSDFHSQAGVRAGVVVTPVLRRFVLRGGEGSGHYGHAGIPGHRGGSLPGDATAEGEQAVHEPRMFKNGMEPLRAYQTGVLAVALDDAMMKVYAEAVGGREQERREVLADMFGVGSSPGFSPSLGGTARAAYKEAIVADLVANVPIMKKDEGDVLYQVTPMQSSAFANDLVHQWSISANDTDMRSLSLQQMIAEQFDVPLSEWQQGRVTEMARLKTFDKGYGPEMQSHKTFAEWGGEQHGLPPGVAETAVKGMLQRMYDRTQEQFLAAGVSEVTLYRGISRDAMLDAFPEPRVLTDPAVRVTLTESNAAESWSFSPIVAEKFAHHGEGLLIAATFPVRQILSTFSTGFGCANEAEVIVLGRLAPVNAHVGSMLENFVEGGLENPR